MSDRKLSRPSRLFAAAALPLALAACQSELTPPTAVVDLRVLSARMDPPEAGPGEQTSFAILATDPNGEGRELDWLVAMCTPDAVTGCLELTEITNRYKGMTPGECASAEHTTVCEQSCLKLGIDCSPEYVTTCCQTLEYGECCARGGKTTAVNGVIELLGDPEAPLTLPETALTELDEREAEDGVNAQLSILLCETGVCFSEDADFSGALSVETLSTSFGALASQLPPDQSASAIKRVRISTSTVDQRNRNPVITGVEVNGSTYGPGDVLEADYGGQYRITPVLTEGSIQSYQFTPEDGQTEERCEALYFSWYRTDGTFEESYSEPAEAGQCSVTGDTLEAASNTWTAPKQNEALEEEVTLFVEARDRRGGMDWLYFTVSMGPGEGKAPGQ